MARIFLTINDKLFDLIQLEANKRTTTPNLLLTDLITNHFRKTLVNSSPALKKVIEEMEDYARRYKLGESIPCEFKLSDLPTFDKLRKEKITNSDNLPTIDRPAMGKEINKMVRQGLVKNIDIAKDTNGNTKIVGGRVKFIVT
jgi:hypothetical protein